MDKRETTRLFRLLQQLYPNAVKFTEEEAMLAWQLVLEPFAYDEIKAAAVQYARINRHPPDPQELCKGLLPPTTAKPARPGAGFAWQRFIEENRLEEPDTFSVSRSARERGLSWTEAAAGAERLGWHRLPA